MFKLKVEAAQKSIQRALESSTDAILLHVRAFL
jgi:hypothetical protein